MKVSIYFFNITPKIIATKSAFDEILNINVYGILPV